ncbi:molybdopterin-guanine dinucleotide biosynthesis protein B [uncultured Helicobacter sp.]|uniref:molybdopterin-guanine dinucleotide biosynthesis protein B n=1 Tax=uncultured Helicobacter sp. TaxID=175537 RepID=UPI00260AC638|nr:molybdopterin-guanine dinucleotide biosynthesis protein B [uncultured Helicobacter sp.]
MQDSKKPIVFAFSGKSNSGKTTLICKLCEYLQHCKIAVIKHDPKDKAMFDTKGKDSYEFFQRSHAVALISPTRTTLQLRHASPHTESTQTQAFYEALNMFQTYDYVFIEGLKTLPFPRIVVAREYIESAYIPYANAFAIDESVANTQILPTHLPILPLNDIANIADFIHQFSHTHPTTKEI